MIPRWRVYFDWQREWQRLCGWVRIKKAFIVAYSVYSTFIKGKSHLPFAYNLQVTRKIVKWATQRNYTVSNFRASYVHLSHKIFHRHHLNNQQTQLTVNRNRPAVPGSQWPSVTSNRKQQNILEQLLHNTSVSHHVLVSMDSADSTRHGYCWWWYKYFNLQIFSYSRA